MHSRLLVLTCLLGWGMFLSTAHADEPQPTLVAAKDARQHVGELVEVRMKVNASKYSLHRKTVYLDSEEDFHDEKNLGIAISERAARELRQLRNVEAPEDFYLTKTIRVTGVVVLDDERPYIRVDEARQLDLLPEAKP